MPKDFRQIATAAPEDVEIAGVGIAFQSLLNLKRETLHAAPHVRVTRRDPNARTAGNGDQDRSAFNVAVINAERRIRPDANPRILYLHQDNARLGLARTNGHRWGNETQD